MGGYFSFGDFNTEDFLVDGVSLKVGAPNVYNAAAQNVEAYNIPGRIGEYLPEDADVNYPNEIREYIVGLFMRNRTPEQVEAALADLRSYLMPYANRYDTLADSYEPNYKRRAYFTSDFVPERLGAGNNYQIPIRFSCDPRRFIYPEVVEQIPAGTDSVEIVNPTNYPAHPFLTVTGCGAAFTLSFVRNASIVGSIQFAAFPNTLDIAFDCETTNAIRLTAGRPSANNLITAVNGKLEIRGTTTIRKTNSAAAVVVAPQFWTR